MHIGRVRTSGGPEYVFRNGAHDRWATANELGFEFTNIGSVVRQLHDIGNRLKSKALEAGEQDSWHWLAPVGPTGKILGIGLNYSSHIAELGRATPNEPTVFSKYPSAVCGPYDAILWPESVTNELDYECELAVIIGEGGKGLRKADALGAILGFCVVNDVSARDLQRTHAQISLSKGMDTFCPLGPWITTTDELSNPQDLRLITRVNGEKRQDGNTKEMIFTVAALVEYISEHTTLEPGDIIMTGTPSGVGSALLPARYLNHGDTVECEISTLGKLSNEIRKISS